MKIAIVGSGVSGLVSAYLLSREHEVTVYEAEDYIGGHTHTIPLPDEGVAVDTGFIVFNHENYPNFVKLLEQLDVIAKPSSMSFSVMNRRSGLEYGFATLNALFAQRSNALRPAFLKMLLEIRKFRKEFDVLQRDARDDQAVGDYLQEKGYSKAFVEDFLIPFGAAIWSASPDQMNRFPLKTFVQFFLNHGFLDTDRLLQWFVVDGGSSAYVTALLRKFRGTIQTRTPVLSIKREADHVMLTAAGESPQRFDHVVLACHSDQALALLADPTPLEQDILGKLPYQMNRVLLHTDLRELPKHRQVWSSWNYCVPEQASDRVTVTYDMNILQGLKTQTEYLVTLNPVREIEPDSIRGTFEYAHPVFTPEGVLAQKRYREIGGIEKRTHYAGAYWGYGFHEDGVRSALRVCDDFKVYL
jgi:uncharacterized protein